MVLGVGLVGLAVGLGCGCLGTFGCLLVLGVVFALNLLNVIGTSPPYARVVAMTSIKTNTIETPIKLPFSTLETNFIHY